MIPKVIHYCWFSGEPFPEQIQKCIDSWHEKMPDYEYVLWDKNRLESIDSVWVKEALSVRKWAFAADYVRLYAVYNYGGIYMDTDCLVYKSFDPLLGGAFIAKEDSFHYDNYTPEQYLSAHCFGAEKGNEFVGRCLSYYQDRHFVRTSNESLPPHLKFDMVVLPVIEGELAKEIGYNSFPSCKCVQNLQDIITVYPSTYFNAASDGKDAYCKHWEVGSWRGDMVTYNQSLISRLLKPLHNFLDRYWVIMKKR